MWHLPKQLNDAFHFIALLAQASHETAATVDLKTYAGMLTCP